MTLLGLITLGVTFAGAVSIVRAQPARAVGLYLAVVMLYPESRTLRLAGTLDVSAGQMLAVPLLLSLILRHRRGAFFRPNGFDALVLAAFLGQWLAAAMHVSFFRLLESQGNHLMMTGAAYLAVRLGVASRAELAVLWSTLLAAAVPLALLGVYESLTGHNLYDTLCMAAGGHHLARPYPMRLGFHRALGSFGNPIPWGLFFAGMMPMAFLARDLRGTPRARTLLLAALCFAGALSSVSSAPLFAALLAIAILAAYPARAVAAPFMAAAGAAALALEFLGPMGGLPAFTDMLSQAALDPNSGSYRMGLLREAFGGGMQGHWIAGFGYVGLGMGETAGEFFWQHTDLVNMYVEKLVRYGLIGAVPWLLVNLAAFVRIAQAYRLTWTPAGTHAVWCVFALFAPWQFALLTVPPMAPLLTLYYAAIGMLAALPALMAEPAIAWDRHYAIGALGAPAATREGTPCSAAM